MDDLNAVRDNAIKEVIADIETRLTDEMEEDAKRRVAELVEETMISSVKDSQSISHTTDYIEETLIEEKLI